MSQSVKTFGLFGLVALLILGTGFVQSWNSALLILNMGLVSALMALGVNLQWGFAGLFNVGVMGFVALGGLATVVIAMPPVRAAWAAGASGTDVRMSVAESPRCASSPSSSDRRFLEQTTGVTFDATSDESP